MSGYLALSYWDLVLASGFLILNAVLSLWLQLGLARQMLVAAVRMVVQLLAVGLVLKAVFAAGSALVTFSLAVVMILFAGREIWARQERRMRGAWGPGLGAAAMTVAGTLVVLIALTQQIGADPWWSPRYALPLFGMILGNTMTGVSLGLDTLTASLWRDAAAVEARLLLGATKWEAVRPFTRRAMRSGMTPIINSMAATGVISLPGMMTGQIFAGVDPTEAVKYQLLIMFLIGGATALGVVLAIVGGIWRLTDERHRLRLDRLAPPTGPA
ncbi:MAG: iron export ABC transporter permease subunit FetB [Paracoccaceae bacterium]|nr:iron export ABC transporter permease subunit FetB [Paracoccaceae bacterium]